MFCLVRTSTSGKPQQGITFLLLDMDTPGISVKPIITLAGEHEVNQVFFDGVRVPKSGRVGEENQGWTVAKYLLEFERGGGSAPGLQVGLERTRRIAAAAHEDDPAHRRRLAETEIAFAASIDPWLRGAAFVAVQPDDSVSVEEAWVQTTALGRGFSLKAGRFFSGIGYLNLRHAHTWDFVDNPLAYQALLGGQYGDDGLQLTWVAPTDLLVELGAEIGRGRGFPGGGDTSRNGAGMRALSAHAGGDVGVSHSWRAGLSMLEAKANGQELVATDTAGATMAHDFSGNTRVWIADAVWKWAPNGNATRTSFTLQGEYLRSTRRGELVYDVGGVDSAGALRAVQSGWYLQGVYQFMPRWRLGLRTERLDSGTPDYGPDSSSLAASLGATGYRPHRNTLMVDFNPSEFSRVRLQFARDRAREGIADNQIFLQYQMSLGAHGAHGY